MKIIRVLCIVLLLFAVCVYPVDGAEEEIVDEFRVELDNFASSLPQELQTDMSEILSSPGGLEAMRDTYSVSHVMDTVWKELKLAWPSALGLLLELFGILIFSALFHRVQSTFSTETVSTAMDLCSTLCIALCITPVIQNVAESGEQYLRMLISLTSGITPVVCALFVSSGNITAAATVNASLMLVYTLFQNIMDVFFLPMIRVMYVLGIVSNVGGSVRLDNLGRCVRRFFTWTLSLITFLLSMLIGIQHAMALSVDSFSLKTAKFALGSFIPLVGSAISDAIGTVAGSLNLIKNTCGTMGILVVILLLLPSLLHLLLQRAVIGVAQGAAELLGCEKEGKLLSEMHSVLGYILAVMALVSVLFVFILALIVSVRF